MYERPPYNGTQRRLVIGMDVGTTFSGISYSILDPGQVPEIKGVNRFPSQINSGGDCKIPSVIYYDKEGHPRAFGAETLQMDIIQQAEIEGWTKVEWFKLHLRPKSIAISPMQLAPLPPRKNVVDIFADMFRYLLFCTKTYIKETHASGDVLWNSVQNNIEFVISHPNGWEGAQQARLRTAAILGGLIPDTRKERSRVSFVTEGEASLNFCIQTGLTTAGMKASFIKGEGTVIVDAGGGTIDISAYYVSLDSKTFEEIAPAQCHIQGAVSVTNRAAVYLQREFSVTQFAEDIPNMVNVFDKNTKLTFRDPKVSSYIKFGGLRDNDSTRNVRGGVLSLPGTRVEFFFRPSIQCIQDAVAEMCQDVASMSKKISTVYLVGGFAASDWLYRSLQQSFAGSGHSIYRPDSHVNKAVADGALIFYLDHFVQKRVAKYHYGVQIYVPYNASLPDHRQRYATSYIDLTSGERGLRDGFSIVLPKGAQVTETQEYCKYYVKDSFIHSNLSVMDTELLVYRGSRSKPEWTDEETDRFSTLCTINADTSNAEKQLRRGPNGVYHEISYQVILLFGPTELKAQIAWEENGVEKRGPATIVYAD